MQTKYRKVRNGRYVELMVDDIEIGRFEVICDKFNENCDMGISIDENYQGQGLARYMIAVLVKNWFKEDPQIRKDKLIFIDVDASAGFWDKIGMIDNRYKPDRQSKLGYLEGKGYEKVITFSKLAKWALGHPLGS